MSLAAVNALPSVVLCGLLSEHLQRFAPRAEQIAAETARESQTIARLLEGAARHFDTFHRALVGVCAEAAAAPNRGALGQSRQTLISALAAFAESAQRQFDDVRGLAETVKKLESELIGQTRRAVAAVQRQRSQLAQKAHAFVADYRALVCEAFGRRGQSSAERLSKAREYSEAVHGALQKQFWVAEDALKGGVEELGRAEREFGQQIGAVCASGARLLLGERVGDLSKRAENDDRIGDLAREFSLEFGDRVSVGQCKLEYFDEQRFARFVVFFEMSYCQQLRARVFLLEKKIDARTRLFFEIFLYRLYRGDCDFDQQSLATLNEQLSNQCALSYFILSALLKKSLVFEQTLGVQSLLPRFRFRAFQQVAHVVLVQDIGRLDAAGELAYHFLRFCTFVACEGGEALAELLGRAPLVHDGQLWLQILNYLQDAFAKGSPPSETVSQALRTHVTTNGLLRIPQSAAGRAFEETAELLFKLSVDLDTVADVFGQLIRAVGPEPFAVRALLQQNEESLFMQIVGQRRFAAKHKNCPPIEDRKTRLAFAFRRALGYLSDPNAVTTIASLNRAFRADVDRFCRAMLCRARLDEGIRRLFIARLLKTRGAAPTLDESLCARQVEPVIALDVRRTTLGAGGHTQLQLECLLCNLARSGGGALPYYQGLNYLANYFFLLFGPNPQRVFEALLRLLRERFVEYVEGDLRGLCRLFFALKKFLRARLPRLAAHFSETLKLNLDVVLASWALTLFTNTTQNGASSPFLDDAIDLFLAKGWPGFLRVVLVVLECLEQRLLRCSYEDALTLLGGLAHNAFADVFVGQNGFDLKVRASRHRAVTRKAVAAFEGEYRAARKTLKGFLAKFGGDVRD